MKEFGDCVTLDPFVLRGDLSEGIDQEEAQKTLGIHNITKTTVGRNSSHGKIFEAHLL